MPQADLHYTADLTPDACAVLSRIEEVIHAFDDHAGTCKGRAQRVEDFHHSHMLLRLSMLPKDHRDATYAAELSERLVDLLAKSARGSFVANVQIRFDLEHYAIATVG